MRAFTQLSLGALLLLSLSAAAQESSGPKQITRELLIAGNTIPERREFPLSKKIPACQDFHKYVCDEVESHFKLPSDRSAWTFSFTDSAERLLYAKKNYFKLLGQGYVPRTERAQQLKEYYAACMNQPARSKEEKALVAAEKATWLGIGREALRAEMFKRLTSPDFTAFKFGTIANQADPLKNDVYVMSEVMSLPEKTYYDKKETVEDLRKLATSLFKSIGMSASEKRGRWVAEYETAFAKTYPLPAEFRKLFTLDTYVLQAEWANKYPGFDWASFFAKFPTSVKVRDLTPKSMDFVRESLEKDDLEKLRSVFIFQSLRDYLDDAYPKYYKNYFAFRKKHFGGPDKRPARDERCTRAVMGSFSMELDQELISVMFPNFPQDKVVRTSESVRSALLSGLKKNTWLSDGARKEALNKMKTAKLNLVKPQREQDWDFLPVQKYEAEAPLKNAKLVRQAKIEKSIKETFEQRNPNRWYMGPLTVNAYYSSSNNQFVLMQGILQYPFFDGSQSEIENIGAIGAVTGHELGHGIDDQGAQYDASGKLRKWMSESDLVEFKKRGDQFVARFDKVGHDGRLTLGENIGDHVGITAAFNAAFPEPEKASVEDLQGFFVAYGRNWCNVMRPALREMYLKTNPHALGEERINQQVVQLPYFASAFSCKAGDPMFVDPKDQIRVW